MKMVSKLYSIKLNNSKVISAVEGLKMSEDSVGMFKLFEDKKINYTDRAKFIINKYKK